MKTYYDILEISENASPEIIDQAYLALSKKYNPDMQPADKKFLAEQKFKEIREAYSVLSNPQLRSEYNLKIGIGSDILKQYGNLYQENQKLKEEVNSLKADNPNSSKHFFKKRKSKSMFSNSVVKDLPSIKELGKAIGTAFYNETKKPKEERSKDLIALIITIIIVGLIIFAFIKVPALNNIIFPKL